MPRHAGVALIERPRRLAERAFPIRGRVAAVAGVKQMNFKDLRTLCVLDSCFALDAILRERLLTER